MYLCILCLKWHGKWNGKWSTCPLEEHVISVFTLSHLLNIRYEQPTLKVTPREWGYKVWLHQDGHLDPPWEIEGMTLYGKCAHTREVTAYTREVMPTHGKWMPTARKWMPTPGKWLPTSGKWLPSPGKWCQQTIGWQVTSQGGTGAQTTSQGGTGGQTTTSHRRAGHFPGRANFTRRGHTWDFLRKARMSFLVQSYFIGFLHPEV